MIGAAYLAYTAPSAQIVGNASNFGINSTSNTVFSEERALLFQSYSHAAYCSLKSIEKWSCGPCKIADPNFKAKAFYSHETGMQAFVGKAADGYIVVSFRGSSNILNWIQNLNVPEITPYPKCKDCQVHKGFYDAWNSVREGVVKEVVALYRQSHQAQIFITGHSLGAAVAAHCAAELGASSQSLGLPIAGVYTYGQPRVGNSAFANFYGRGTRVSWRLTHWRDPVPQLPVNLPPLFKFKHIATEVFYNEASSQHIVCDGSGEDAHCSNSLDFHLSVPDHLHYLNQSISKCDEEAASIVYDDGRYVGAM